MLRKSLFTIEKPTTMELITCLYLVYALFPMLPVNLPQMVRYCISVLILGITIIYLLCEDFSYSMLLIVAILIFTLCLYKGTGETNLISYVANALLFWESLLLGRHYLISNEAGIGRIIKVYFIIQFVTLITTILGCYYYPLASRELAKGLVDSKTLFYQKMNIGGYRFIYGLVIALPYAIMGMKEKRLSKKVFCTIFFAASIYCLLIAQYTTALLIMCLLIFISLVYNENRRARSIVLVIASIVLIFVLRYAVAELLNSLAEKTARSNLDSISERFQLLYEYITKGSIDGDAADRQDVYMMSFEAFKRSPIFGAFFSAGTTLGGHSAVLDILGGIGVVGLLQFVGLLYWHVRGILRFRMTRVFKYGVISLLGFLIVMSLNTIFTSVDVGVAVFLIPILLAKAEIEEAEFSCLRKRTP